MDEGYGRGEFEREGPSQRGHQRVFAWERCFMPAGPHYRSRGEEPCERSTPTQGRVLPSTPASPAQQALILPIIQEMPQMPVPQVKSNSYSCFLNTFSLSNQFRY